jgi:hypothetical protein
LSPILHLLPVGGPINEVVNLHSNDGEADLPSRRELISGMDYAACD